MKKRIGVLLLAIVAISAAQATAGGPPAAGVSNTPAVGLMGIPAAMPEPVERELLRSTALITPGLDVLENQTANTKRRPLTREKICIYLCSKDPNQGGHFCNCDKAPM